MTICKHPLIRRVSEILQSVEALPGASQELTEISIALSELGQAIEVEIDRIVSTSPIVTDAARALLCCAGEIKGLRRSNELLAAKVDVIEIFRAALTRPESGLMGGFSEDHAWRAESIAAALTGSKE